MGSWLRRGGALGLSGRTSLRCRAGGQEGESERGAHLSAMKPTCEWCVFEGVTTIRNNKRSRQARCRPRDSRDLIVLMALALAVSVAALLLPGSTPTACTQPICASDHRRVAASPRCAQKDTSPTDTSSPLGGEFYDESVIQATTSADGTELTPEERVLADIEFVRPPPAYPEGLHDAAKADRSGPFWSSLGEPDVSTGVRPAYLRRDDWHISSTYTAEQRAAVAADEKTWIESVAIETPVDNMDEEEDEDYDPFAEKEYMKLEPGPPASGGTASEQTMPASWQDYQALQSDLAILAHDDSALNAAERAQAATHVEQVDDFYITFKDILSETFGGWTLLNNREVEAAVKFALVHRVAGSEDRVKWEVGRKEGGN